MGRLVVGTTSKDALEVQRALNMARRPGTPKIPEDGAVTDELLDRIRDFQKHCGLQRNGQPDSATMKALALEASSEPMEFQITLRGRTYLLSKRDYQQLVERTIRALRYKGPAGDIAANTRAIRAFWNDMNRNNQRSPFVSFLIESTRGVQLPSESVVKRAEKAAKDVDSALNSRDLKATYAAMRRAEPIINSARKELYAYRKAVIEGGERWITALTFTKDASFLAVGIMAGPVAASYGAGAIASGVIAGAGTAAVETLSTEVGRGLAGSSEGVGAATKNVLRDAVIGGAIGAIVKGKFAEKIVEGIGAQVARRVSAQWVSRIGQRAATQYIKSALKGALANALEGAASDVLKQFRSNPEKLTWDKFMQSVALNLVSGGVFSKLDDYLTPSSRNLISSLPSNFRRDLSRALGRELTSMELETLIVKAGNTIVTQAWDKSVEQVLSRAKGSEKPELLKRRVVDKTFDAKMINRLVNLQKTKRILR